MILHKGIAETYKQHYFFHYRNAEVHSNEAVIRLTNDLNSASIEEHEWEITHLQSPFSRCCTVEGNKEMFLTCLYLQKCLMMCLNKM